MMNTKPSRGFTLVETMVAIAIVTVAVIGPMYAIQQGVVGSYTARDRLMASGLAQEGLEFIHAVRDNNYLYNIKHPTMLRSWFYGLDGAASSVDCTDGASCTIDSFYNTVRWCSGTCEPLNLRSTGLYNQEPSNGTNPPTRFTRSVQLTRINPHEMRVTVTVSWSTSRIPYSITLTENIQDWL